MNVIQAVSDNALLEAEELEESARQREAKAANERQRAAILRQLHQIALPWAKQSIMEGS